MVKRDWSIRAMRGRARRARLAAPFALRDGRRGPGSGTRRPSRSLSGRLARGRGEELVDRAGDVAGDRTLVAVGVQHDEPSRLGRREAQIAVAHALVEGAIAEVETVPAVVALAPRAEARQRLREPRRLERFPQALAALEREEEPPAHRYMCTRR